MTWFEATLCLVGLKGNQEDMNLLGGSISYFEANPYIVRFPFFWREGHAALKQKAVET